MCKVAHCLRFRGSLRVTLTALMSLLAVSVELSDAASTKFLIRKVGDNVSPDDDRYRISGKNVVWHEQDRYDRNQIYLYNGSTTTQLTNNNYYASWAQISGTNVVWEGYDGNDTEIYLYNGTTTTQVTDNSWNDLHPQISGTNVAWKGWDGNDYEIYLYDGSTTTQLTDDTGNDEAPQISGTNVVWNDPGSNIHFYNGDPWTTLSLHSTGNSEPQNSARLSMSEQNTQSQDAPCAMRALTSVAKVTAAWRMRHCHL